MKNVEIDLNMEEVVREAIDFCADTGLLEIDKADALVHQAARFAAISGLLIGRVMSAVLQNHESVLKELTMFVVRVFSASIDVYEKIAEAQRDQSEEDSSE